MSDHTSSVTRTPAAPTTAASLFARSALRAEASERADRTNAARKILIIVVLAASIGEVNVVGHVRAHLRRTPVATVIGQSLIAKVRGAGGLQVAMHQRQFVARRQEPAAHAIQTVVGAELRRCSSFRTGGEHLFGVFLPHAHRCSASACKRAA